ncbi:MAG: HD domain-containing protein [Bacteroidaceae bacterium]|nr:HD domain-containing protein [Bacteroidaceae bacterium]
MNENAVHDIDGLLAIYEGEERNLTAQAYDVARTALDGVQRSDGTPFLGHALNVAAISAFEIGLPAGCTASVFLHEAMSCGGCGQEVLNQFPQDIRTIVKGLNHISAIRPKDTRLEAENYKNLIVSYSSDPRIIVLKLADRLEVMRNIDIFPKSARDNKMLETLLLYIPLAHQLGLYNMKSEMEDIYFRYAEPQQYRSIRNHLSATEKDRRKITELFIGPLKEKLAAAGISYQLKARTKTAFSIWNKMQKQNVGFSGVFDIFAIRFIIDPEKCEPVSGPDGSLLEGLELERALCWKVFSFVTEKYRSDTSRLRDWLSKPKPNGYESLHITVSNEEGAVLEVQIRTRRMDETAEKGLASHWSYKGIRSDEKLVSWMSAARAMLENGALGQTLSPQDSGEDEELPAPPADDIFVFTPTGELRRLRTGSTVLDFAFNIHSGLGCHCSGGKVNGKGVSIREELHTGDVVEIITSKNQHPSQAWLSFVVTGKARTKIRQKLGEEEFKKAAEGKELLERRLRNWKMEISDQELGELMKKWQYRTKNSFFADLGSEKIDIIALRDAVLAMREARTGTPREQAEEKRDWGSTASQSAESDDILILNAHDVKGLDYCMARCCKPVFGDEVFGFVSVRGGVKIHRMSCPNAARLIEKYPYRVQKVAWSDTPSGTGFQTTLRITTLHENSVITDITGVTEQFKASIRGLNVSENQRSGTYEIQLTISVSSNLELGKVIAGIRSVRSVTRVLRS